MMKKTAPTHPRQISEAAISAVFALTFEDCQKIDDAQGKIVEGKIDKGIFFGKIIQVKIYFGKRNFDEGIDF